MYRSTTLAAVAATLIGISAAARAGELNIGVILSGEITPGVYGQVMIGNTPPPPLLYAQPLIIEAPATRRPPDPGVPARPPRVMRASGPGIATVTTPAAARCTSYAAPSTSAMTQRAARKLRPRTAAANARIEARDAQPAGFFTSPARSKPSSATCAAVGERPASSSFFAVL